ncbi:tetratricopeptide repeat protein [Streptomyces avermitilis]|uniref:tetratricopeptide repeat protein n=1 Tax=Streptomyces avermitilis TaxID=33903 RepID=UPI0033F03431
MHEADNSRGPALAELHGRLEEARARARLNQTELAGLAGLGRATVGKALALDGGVPSANTVARLARALKLSAGELLELRRTAMEEADGHPADMPGPGRPIEQWEPHELEVHPAGPGTIAVGERALPGYVERRHDEVLAAAVREAAQGRSRIVVLVGSSSTGKTRACWEAVQPLATKRWRLWHPFDPTRAEAALEELHQVGPRTVVWLNEAQHYFGDRACGERIAAAVHRLLTDEERGPVLVLGTLWPEYADRYTALPAPNGNDPHTRVRELLTGRTVAVPDAFDAAALAAATLLAEEGDALLADALTRAREGGRITQDLAGAPELLRRYEQATPPARALLHAAMDARRLFVGPHIAQTFLTDAASDYLSKDDYDQLTDDWAEQAYAELATPGHGKQAPLRRVRARPQRRPPGPQQPAEHPSPQPAGTMFRLADYLEEHGRSTRSSLCPPASFWDAAHAHLTDPDDLDVLVEAAENRHRLEWAHHLRHRAASLGSVNALYVLAGMREDVDDREEAENLYRRAADLGDTDVLFNLALLREAANDREGADDLARQAGDLGNINVLSDLAELREEAGDREGAEALARLAAGHGSTATLYRLAMMREEAGDRPSAESLYEQLVKHVGADALYCLAVIRENREDQAGAETLYQRADDHRDLDALCRVVEVRHMVGDSKGAEALARRAAVRGRPDALHSLALSLDKAGDENGADRFYQEAADHGITEALYRLGRLREKAKDLKGAETFYREAVEHGITEAFFPLAVLRERAGDGEDAEDLYRQAVDNGKSDGLRCVVTLRERMGDREGAESLARQLADNGDPNGMGYLGHCRETAGDKDSAESLYRQAVERGSVFALNRLTRLREQAGDLKEAERLAQLAADFGSPDPLYRLGLSREKAGDREGAEHFFRQVADRGRARDMPPDGSAFSAWWPDGLDPDGLPTLPWR